MQNFQYGLSGLKLTESFEGVRLKAYQDVKGIWTIGYGHTGPDVHPGLVITQPEADALLTKDVQNAVRCVNEAVKVQITQDEFDALVDFTFNDGSGNFEGSTLLKDLNAGNRTGAAAEFLLWVNSGGHRIPGLVRRRQAEEQLFLH